MREVFYGGYVKYAARYITPRFLARVQIGHILTNVYKPELKPRFDLIDLSQIFLLSLNICFLRRFPGKVDVKCIDLKIFLLST